MMTMSTRSTEPAKERNRDQHVLLVTRDIAYTRDLEAEAGSLVEPRPSCDRVISSSRRSGEGNGEQEVWKGGGGYKTRGRGDGGGSIQLAFEDEHRQPNARRRGEAEQQEGSDESSG